MVQSTSLHYSTYNILYAVAVLVMVLHMSVCSSLPPPTPAALAFQGLRVTNKMVGKVAELAPSSVSNKV